MLFYLIFGVQAFASIFVLFMYNISIYSILGTLLNLILVGVICLNRFKQLIFNNQIKEEVASLCIGILFGAFIFSGLYPVMIENAINQGVIWNVLLTFIIIGAYGNSILIPAFLSNLAKISHQPTAPTTGDVQTKQNKDTPKHTGIPKILDTSIIIDGRIIDIVGTKFIDGPFIVPHFVLREMQLISDSEDPIKRSRGRRGLDMLNQLRKEENLEIKIDYTDYSDTREVDAKLVKLAKELDAKLITNDFNLNKVAQVQDVIVLNINTLIQALKPIVIPGEEFEIQIVREGKEATQGIGYLDDGTMVIVENGKTFMNKTVTTTVTSVIQTNAGKMIFSKI